MTESLFVPGVRLSPSLRLVHRLAVGGMGSVWLAHDEARAHPVAVKVIADANRNDPAARARFAREAVAAKRLRHRHIVELYDVGEMASGVPYLVMELLSGEDLATRIRRGAWPSTEAATRIVTEIGEALQAAHALGIVHRDVKPANVFLHDAGAGEAVKLLDFGVAKMDAAEPQDLTTRGAIVGTPYYMSPEQIAARRDVDRRTDVWSLGVVTFQLLTGELPFAGESIGALTLAIHQKTAPKPSARNPSLPPAVDAWFARACAVDRSVRFARADEAAAALRDALRSSGDVRVPLPNRGARGATRTGATLTVPARRGGAPWKWALVVAATAVAMAGLVVRRAQVKTPAPESGPAVMPLAEEVAPPKILESPPAAVVSASHPLERPAPRAPRARPASAASASASTASSVPVPEPNVRAPASDDLPKERF